MRKATQSIRRLIAALSVLAAPALLSAQAMPTDYQEALKIIGKSGDYKQNVLKVNVPRNDLHVTIADYPVPTAFGFGRWFALTKGEGGNDVMMGDLVLLENEVQSGDVCAA